MRENIDFGDGAGNETRLAAVVCVESTKMDLFANLDNATFGLAVNEFEKFLSISNPRFCFCL